MQIEAFCSFPFTRCRITSEGDVAMCCFQRPDPLSSDSPYIGNVLKNTFDEVWFGELAEEIRLTTLEGKLHKKCQVPGCPFFCGKPPYRKEKFVYNEYPTFLELDLPNTHCNIGLEKPNAVNPACIMCERAGPPDVFKPEANKLEEVLPRIAHILSNLQQIHIQGIAEPFYKELFFEILDSLEFDKYRDRITVSTTTNGTLLNQYRRKAYLERVPRSITNFSIDAATAETYKKIRILPLFPQVLDNLYNFSKERRRNRQFLRICNNINVINVHEVIGMVQIAHRSNVEYVEFNPTDGFNRKILVNSGNCGLFKKAQMDIIEECERLKVPVNFIRPLDLGMTDQMIL